MKNFKQVMGIMALLMLVATITFAQTTISGKITDSESGEALIGANILIKGTYSGTTTDLSGDFSLSTSQDLPLTLVVSYAGYTSQDVEVRTNNATVDVALVSGYTANEVVVTAQLREQQLQEVPIAISVLDAKFLETNPDINNIDDILLKIPGLSGGDFTGGVVYSIRGISSNLFNNSFETSVGIFQDGVFTGRITSAGNEFYDIERVEVLKGPQGTLFGRNTSAGAVSITTKKADFKKDLSLGVSFGNEGQLIGDYMVNLPLSDKLSVRWAGRYQQRDGLVKATDPDTNIESELNKVDFFGNRLSFGFKGDNNFFANLILAYSNSDRGGTAQISTSALLRDGLGVPIPDDQFERNILQNGPPRDDTKNFAATLLLNKVINDGLAFESISGYRRNQLDYRFDVDASLFGIAIFENEEDAKSFTQEFRLKGKSKKVDWVAAANLFFEDSWQPSILEADDAVLDLLFADGALGLAPNVARETHIHVAQILSTSVFADATIHLTDAFDLTVGARLSFDKKDFSYDAELADGAFQQALGVNVLTVDYGLGTTSATADESWTAFQPRVNLAYKLSPNAMVYGGYSRGYKPGGLNYYDLRVVEPENNDAFELGLKTSFPNGKGYLNLAGFLYDYKDLQVEEVVNGAIGANNASDVSSIGLEVETGINLSDNFTIGGNLTLINAEYEDFMVDGADLSGNQTIYTPKTSYNINAQFNAPLGNAGTLYIQTDYGGQSEVFFNQNNARNLSAPAYGIWNAAAGVKDLGGGKFDVGIFLNNILDEEYIQVARDDLGDLPYIVRGVPFLAGVTIRAHNLLK